MIDQTHAARRAAVLMFAGAAASHAGEIASGLGLAPDASAAYAQTTLVESTFDKDDEGWSIGTNDDACALPSEWIVQPHTWQSTDGNPGGHVRQVDPREGRTAYWVAPAEFHGDFSAAYNGRLTYDLRQSSTSSPYAGAEIYVIGGGITLVLELTYHPRTFWTSYEVALAEWGGWRVGRCDGPIATEADVRAVLADITGLYIRAEYRSGADTSDLDNVRISDEPPAHLVPFSNFNTDGEGWWIIGDAVPSWDPAEGQPAGALRGLDNATGDSYRFIAPTKFLGPRGASVGQTITVDIKATPSINDPDVPGDGIGFVTLMGNGVHLTYREYRVPIVGDVWRRFGVPLTPCPAWTHAVGGAPATQQDFETALASLSRFTVRGEYRDGNETEWLDNVGLGVCDPSAVAFPVGLTGTCPGGTVQFSAAVGGGGKAGLTVRWQHDGEPLTDDAHISGSDTATLTITDVLPHHAGAYECVASAACEPVAPEAVSNAVELAVCTGDFDCNGLVNAADVGAFLTAYFSDLANGTTHTDFDGNGIVNAADVGAFLTEYFASLGDCP